MATQVGVISDTHGLLRPEAITALIGSDLILHAGDIGKPEILAQLTSIAPVIAVRGNNDKGIWATSIAEHEMIKVEEVSIYLLHIVQELNFDPKSADVQIIISGHSHKPCVRQDADVLFVNPGSAGPRRFKLPVSVARLQIESKTIDAQIIELSV